MENQQLRQNENLGAPLPTVKRRNVFLCLLFSVLTGGIYFLYWFICLTNETNRLSRFKTAGGGLALLFSILTLGIYMFYWFYMLGKKAGDIDKDSSSGALYLILSLFGLGFISYILAQSALNRYADRQPK